jgi:hypothetical protein
MQPDPDDDTGRLTTRPDIEIDTGEADVEKREADVEKRGADLDTRRAGAEADTGLAYPSRTEARADASADSPVDDRDERLVRAQRIKERSKELVEALGPDHPLVAAALERAESLERQARNPGTPHLH